jgi:hypothetical protein
MGRKIQHLAKVGLFTIRYLVFPFIAVFGVVFFIMMFPNIGVQSLDYFPLILVSLLYGWVISSPIFFMQIAMQISVSLGKKAEKKVNSLENRLSKRFKPSIKTRLELKKYFGALSVSIFLVFSVLFAKSVVTQFNVIHRGIELPSIEVVAAYVSLIVALFFLQLYIVAYRQTEKALFFFEQSVENINYCLEDDVRRPYIRFFEKALKAYQKTEPSIKDLERRIRQMGLVFRRGTRDDIIKIRDIINSFTSSIREHSPSSFDDSFKELAKFLDEFEKKKNDMYKFDMIPRREMWKNTLFDLFKPSLKKWIGYLILLAIVAFLSLLFGYERAKDLLDSLSRLFG